MMGRAVSSYVCIVVLCQLLHNLVLFLVVGEGRKSFGFSALFRFSLLVRKNIGNFRVFC